jgi:hypothetical protein
MRCRHAVQPRRAAPACPSRTPAPANLHGARTPPSGHPLTGGAAKAAAALIAAASRLARCAATAAAPGRVRRRGRRRGRGRGHGRRGRRSPHHGRSAAARWRGPGSGGGGRGGKGGRRDVRRACCCARRGEAGGGGGGGGCEGGGAGRGRGGRHRSQSGGAASTRQPVHQLGGHWGGGGPLGCRVGRESVCAGGIRGPGVRPPAAACHGGCVARWQAVLGERTGTCLCVCLARPRVHLLGTHTRIHTHPHTRIKSGDSCGGTAVSSKRLVRDLRPLSSTSGCGRGEGAEGCGAGARSMAARLRAGQPGR